MTGKVLTPAEVADPGPIITLTKRLHKFSDFMRLAILSKQDECMNWPGRKLGGYGRINWKGKNSAAHRVVYLIAHGAIPDGLCVCHKCDTPTCVNLRHLFIGTNKENMQDRNAKGRQAHGSSNGKAKLTTAKVLLIRAMKSDGAQIKAIAKFLDIGETAVFNVCHGKTWRKVA